MLETQRRQTVTLELKLKLEEEEELVIQQRLQYDRQSSGERVAYIENKCHKANVSRAFNYCHFLKQFSPKDTERRYS